MSIVHNMTRSKEEEKKIKLSGLHLRDPLSIKADLSGMHCAIVRDSIHRAGEENQGLPLLRLHLNI